MSNFALTKVISNENLLTKKLKSYEESYDDRRYDGGNVEC